MRLLSAPASVASRTMLALAGLLALVAVVSVAAAGRAPATGEKVPSSSSHSLLVDYISTFFLLIMPLGAVLIVGMTFLRKGEIARGHVKKGSRLNYLILLVLLLALVALRAANTNWHPLDNGHKAAPFIPKVSPGPKQPTAQTPTQQARFNWLPAVLLGAVALGLLVSAGTLAIRRRRGTLDGPINIEAELSDALEESIDDLRNEPDPRKAVIRTYARMEKIFAAHGAPKQPFEAPLEYLGRALGIVQASAHSASRVTKLFERARFSSHGVDERMKDDAIGALVALRSELEAAR